MPHNDIEDNPSTQSEAYRKMSGRWDVMNNVLLGTEAMRKAGEKFLPKHIAETDDRYKNRLYTAVFRNMTEDTIESLIGRPFSEPLKVSADMPEDLLNLVGDIDAHGDSLDSFAKKWFRSSVSKGFCHVLVEFPRLNTPEGGTRTLADDRNQGVRPYLCRIEPENLISMRTEMIAGEEIIAHARVMRHVDVPISRWSSAHVQEIMVLEPGTVEIFRQEDPTDPESPWVRIDGWLTGLNYVPLVTFYTSREDTACGKPPMLDLAYANIAHWQSSSDQRVILSTARLPILAVAGMSSSEADNIVIGPFKFLSSNSPESKFYYVEHEGNAIQAGANDLKSLEEWMSSYGAEFLKRKSGGQTATARALDSAEAMSKLQSWVVDFEDVLAKALGYMKGWLSNGADFSGGTVELVTDYDYGELDQTAVHAITDARSRKDISRKAFIEEMKRRDILSDTYDEEADVAIIEQEHKEEMTRLLVVTEASKPEPQPQPEPKEEDK